MSPQTELAWANVTHNKARAAAGVAGVAFATLLMFMQLGFYDTSFRSSTMVFDQLAFDIAVRSPQYAHLRAPGTLPRRRLSQAEGVAGVARAVPLYVGNGVYHEPVSRRHREIIVLAVDPSTDVFAIPEVSRNLHLLTEADAALMDTITRTDYDAVRIGQMPAVDGRRVRIAATYAHGTGFLGDATMVVSDRSFARIFPAYPLSNVGLGLVTVTPGVSVDAVVERLRTRLPSDVQVLTRAALEAEEQNFFVRIRPLGVMFTSGVWLAFVVGAVIVYQILSSEIANRLREYATLKAMGHDDSFVRGVVVRQAVLYAMLGAIPAVPLAFVLYEALEFATHLPMVMTAARIVLVCLMALAMSVGAALLAIRKLSRADPAELF